MIYFDALTESDCEQIRKWRNADIAGARTPFLLTQLQQKDFYEKVVSDRDSKHRYWAICEYRDTAYKNQKILLGIAGLTNIESENGRAEIALMIGPNYRNQGYGKQAIKLLKQWGFDRMRLFVLYANVYECNPDADFWDKLNADFHVYIPYGKWWNNERFGINYYQWHNEE